MPAAATLVAALALHVADHALRQDVGVPAALGALGLAGAALAVALLALAILRSTAAAAAAVAVGLGTALGFAAVHLAPDWSSALSFSYPDLELDALSWTSMLAAMAAAVWVALEGVRGLRREHETASARGSVR